MRLLKKMYKVFKWIFIIIYFSVFSFVLYLSVIVERDVLLFFFFLIVMLVFLLLFFAISRYNDKQIIDININNDIALFETFSTTYSVSVYENIIIRKTYFRYIVIFDNIKLHLLQDGFPFYKISRAYSYLNEDFFPNIIIEHDLG